MKPKQVRDFENYQVHPCGKIVNTKTGSTLKHSLNENGYLYVSLWKEGKGYTRTVHRIVAEAFLPNPEGLPIVNHIDANRANPQANNLEWCDQSHNIKHSYQIGNRSQKRNFAPEEEDWLLEKFLAGNTMTALAKSMSVGISRLTINLRNRAVLSGKSDAFEAELRRQKTLRNTQANANKRKPVSAYTLSGELFANYPSAAAAARALGMSSSGSIINSLNPQVSQKTAGGYKWKYS